METGPTPRAAPSWGQGDRGREGPRRPGGAGPGAGLLTGPTKPSSPVRVKGLSETGAPAAVSGAVCVEQGLSGCGSQTATPPANGPVGQGVALGATIPRICRGAEAAQGRAACG